MGFSIRIDFDEKQFDGFLQHKLKDKIALGVRQGLNRTIRGVRKDASDEIRNVFNPKAVSPTRIKQDFRKERKAYGLDISQMEASVELFSKRGLSAIRFADNKAKQKQKGIPVKKRVSYLSLSLKRNLKKRAAGAFIQNSKFGGKSMFRAKDGVSGKGRLLTEYYLSVPAMLADDDVLPHFEEALNRRLEKEVAQAVGKELDRLS